jgi:hypothetical protein
MPQSPELRFDISYQYWPFAQTHDGIAVDLNLAAAHLVAGNENSQGILPREEEIEAGPGQSHLKSASGQDRSKNHGLYP